MASSYDGGYDVAFKSKLLRSLLRDYVPHEKYPFSNPSELSYVVSTIKAHHLLSEMAAQPVVLSEMAPQPVDKDSIDHWKAAVDSWFQRLLTLVSSNLPDKCWAGICLLGVTCQECSSERFLVSYSEWLNKLISLIQLPVTSNFVKAACCASLSDMFTRLSGLSSAKKEASSQATRVIQPLLELLNEDTSSVVLEEAVCLLCTMIKCFPLSVHRNYDTVEAAIVSKLVSGNCDASVLKKLSHCLSLLPKSKGDEDSWSLMMVKILLCMNNQLNDVFQGLEEDSRGTEIVRVLLPAGREPPPPLGGLALSEQFTDLLLRRPERLLASRISALMDCCCNMLTNSYPVVVPVPVRALLALIQRVLMVDGSLFSSSYSFMTTLKQELICVELPIMQLHSLDILMAIVKGFSSHLLPHVAAIVRLLTEYLRRCTSVDLRIKAYSIMKVLLISMGTGIAIHISQNIIINVGMDLDFLGSESEKTSGSYKKVHVELLGKSRQRKRKHSSLTGSLQEQPAPDDFAMETSHNLTPLSVRIAALEALEALLTVGGSMRSESWRANVDRLAITVAMYACKMGFFNDERKVFLPGEPASIWADFQLAALRTLLASLLSPGRARPPHLALGLELFRRGMQETGTKVSEYCEHAIKCLEVLIHPRSLPVLDPHWDINDYKISSHMDSDAMGHRQVYAFQAGKSGKGPREPESDDDDELNENWLGNDESEMETAEGQQIANYTGISPTVAKDSSKKEVPAAEVRHGAEASDLSISANQVANEGIGHRDELMVESPYLANVGDQSGTGTSEYDKSGPLSKNTASTENIVSSKSDMIYEVTREKVASVSEHVPASTPEHVPASIPEHVSQTKDDGFNSLNSLVERMSATLSNTERSTGYMSDSDNDSIPSIVDGDPDSD